MIRVESAFVAFPQGGGEDRVVLRDLSLVVPRGQTVSIIGSNGAGKSTLLNAIAGTVSLRSGSIVVDGRDCARDPEWIRARYVGRVRQNPPRRNRRRDDHRRQSRPGFTQGSSAPPHGGDARLRQNPRGTRRRTRDGSRRSPARKCLAPLGRPAPGPHPPHGGAFPAFRPPLG